MLMLYTYICVCARGCLFHGYKCTLTEGIVTNPANGVPMTTMHNKTKLKEDYLYKSSGIRSDNYVRMSLERFIET